MTHQEQLNMTDKKALTKAIGTLSALSLSLGAFAADPTAENLFQAETLDRGFMSQQAGFGEGACGEGTCGEDHEKKDDKDEEGACGEGACGEGTCGEDDKDEEGTCGEGACGEGTCGAA
jgi:uncharacterized low-complexity protein